MLDDQDIDYNAILEIEIEDENKLKSQKTREKKEKKEVELKNNFQLFISKEKNREEDLKDNLLYIEDEGHGLEIKDEKLEKAVKEDLKEKKIEQEKKIIAEEVKERSLREKSQGLQEDSQEEQSLNNKKGEKITVVLDKKKQDKLFKDKKKPEFAKIGMLLKTSETKENKVKIDEKLQKLQKIEDKLIKKKLKARKKKDEEQEHCCIKFEYCLAACCRGLKNCFYCVIKTAVEGYEYLTEELANKFIMKFKGCFASLGFVDGKNTPLIPIRGGDDQNEAGKSQKKRAEKLGRSVRNAGNEDKEVRERVRLQNGQPPDHDERSQPPNNHLLCTFPILFSRSLASP